MSMVRDTSRPRPRPAVAGHTGIITAMSLPNVTVTLDREDITVSCQVTTGATGIAVGSPVFVCRYGRRYIVLGVIGDPGAGDETGDNVPAGVIVMWSGTLASIPEGWALCDGNNGTPDLRDRFILGTAAGEQPGALGGSHTKTLSVANLPSHNHTASTNSTGAHTHVGRWKGFSISPGTGYYVLRRISAEDSYDGTDNIVHSAGGNHTHTVTVSNTGSGTAFDIRPKYYKVAFIMKL